MNLNKFKTWLQLNCNSKRTIQSYWYEMKQYFDYKFDFSQEKMDEYYISLIERNLKPNTLNQFRKACNKYSEFSGIKVVLPKSKKVNKKSDKSDRQYITEEQLKKDIIPYISLLSRKWEEDIIILKTLFYTGLRREELINLRQVNLFFDQNIKTKNGVEKGNYLLVTETKGGEDRKIVFKNSLKTELKRVLLINQGKEKVFSRSYQSLGDLIHKIGKNLNLKISTHSFRHSFARHMLQKGLDLHNLKLMMGHSDIKTTEIYLEDLTKEYSLGICWNIINRKD